MAYALSTRPIHSVRNLAVVVLVVWFLLALGGSLLGIFDSESRPPIPLGLAAVIPVAVFAFGYLTSVRFREFVLSLDLRILTVAHTWRVGGIVFLILHQQGALPGVFALPAGWGDIAIGILDLVMAVSLGVLASATPVGVLAGDVTTRFMGRFPLSLIPTFFVPLLLIFHLISLLRVRKGVA